MRFRPAILDRWQRARRFRRHLRHFLPAERDAPKLWLSIRKGIWNQAEFVRSRGWVRVILGDQNALDGARRVYYFHAMPTLMHIMSRVAPGVRINVEIGDGSSDPSDQVAFSSNQSATVLVPDPDFFNTRGYQRERTDTAAQQPWRERDSKIVWRGSSTGWDHETRNPLNLADPNCNQRVRVCAVLRDEPDTDVKISNVVEPLNIATDVDILKQAGLFGAGIPQESWRDRKFALDIDGNANAFSNLFVRLLYGCCVIKIGSPRQFRQWYYERLEPWMHYVPVRADLSDLRERIAWCRSHLDDCEAIATAGKALATSITFETEMADAVCRLNARFGVRS